jgi:hypothetical protein
MSQKKECFRCKLKVDKLTRVATEYWELIFVCDGCVKSQTCHTCRSWTDTCDTCTTCNYITCKKCINQACSMYHMKYKWNTCVRHNCQDFTIGNHRVFF